MKEHIEKCYETLKGYPLKDKIDGCPCCRLDSSEKTLHTKSLKSLSFDDLEDFIFKSMTTFGDVDDFKHFLPRILELYIDDFFGAPYDVGILFSKLEYAKWEEWPESEYDALNQLIKAWINTLKKSKSDTDLEILENIRSDMDIYETDLGNLFF